MRTDDDYKRATHDYVCRRVCGCIVRVFVDMGDKWTAQSAASAIRDGLTMDRVTHEEWIALVDSDGIGCKCAPAVSPQPDLFSVPDAVREVK